MHDDRDPLLSQRSALVFLLGACVGIGATVLAAWGDAGPATAMLTGGGSFGAGVYFFHSIIG
ncbi:hypothetical protein [Streptomyces sp. AK02-01A]|uniref:hypothetical protein n=1 Tax=Streptomyces sp. AK02-01A TaxID=3028648 RepID=UPI0029AFC8F9|nr:hypothetical protein [Streptomyces sp. AK02-01A]MDX3849149.1 hypothetical protein [Streptomyces sp. AK02-01A]